VIVDVDDAVTVIFGGDWKRERAKQIFSLIISSPDYAKKVIFFEVCSIYSLHCSGRRKFSPN
jgi:hypothetical protein